MPAVRTNANRVPVLALVCGIALTVLSLVVVAFESVQMGRKLNDIATTEMALVRLDGDIRYLDEVLTMSARMSAASGEPEWRRRYDRHVVRLDAALAEVYALVPEAADAAAVHTTDQANAVLVSLEGRAFEAVERGDRVHASRLLNSLEYSEAKADYAEGQRRLSQAISDRVSAHLQRAKARARALTVVVTVAFAMVLLGWLGVALVWTRHQRAQQAERRRLHEGQQRLAQERERLAAHDNATLRELNETLSNKLDELALLQDALNQSAREAGMADVARSVLHSVGNALSGIQTSATLLTDHVQQEDHSWMVRTADLLRSHGATDGFFAEGGRGSTLPDYLQRMAHHASARQQRASVEMEVLMMRMQSALAALASHESYVKASPAVFRDVAVQQLLMDALVRVAAHRDDVSCVVEGAGHATVDAFKVIRVVAQLLSWAMSRAVQSVTARATASAGEVVVVITCDGPPLSSRERLGLFSGDCGASHGALHQCACSALEMGGGLTGEPSVDGGVLLTLRVKDWAHVDQPVRDSPAA